MVKWIAVGVWLSVLAGCASPVMSPPEAEAIYQKRFALLQSGNPAANYDPMEPVPGAATPRPLPVADAASLTIDRAALSTARDYAERSHATAFLVWRDGALQDASYFGTTTRDTELGSLSLAKPLATLAIGRAMALGKIKSLDQPVADFIPDWRATPKDKILLRDILRMTSGLQAQNFSAGPETAMSLAYLHPYHERFLVRDYPLTDPPGTRYAYSNATAELVALIIERATGRRYASFLSDALLAPIGAAGGRVWIDRPDGLAHSGCCILLPAETWLRLGVLVLQDGVWDGKRLIGQDVMTLMTSPNPAYSYASTMGMYVAGRYTARRGFNGPPSQPGPQVLHSAPYLSADLVLFDGNADQVVYILPSAHLVALRMGAAPPKTPEWDNSVIPNTLLRGIDWHGNPPVPQPR